MIKNQINDKMIYLTYTCQGWEGLHPLNRRLGEINLNVKLNVAAVIYRIQQKSRPDPTQQQAGSDARAGRIRCKSRPDP